MLSFLRRLTKSRVGVVVTMIGLILIALAFGLTGIGSSFRTSGVTKDMAAQVGSKSISTDELRQRIQEAVEAQRQQQPDITMAQFIQQGGVDDVLGQVINTLALDQFGKSSGMAVSQKVVDGEIASIPAFRGVDGKFSQQSFDQLLKARGLTADALRDDIRQGIMAQWLLAPTIGAHQFPEQLALPYASLLLEKRHGTIGFIPTQAVPLGDKPSDQELQAYYKRNVADYTVPQRRVIDYALVTPDKLGAKAEPSEAEIEQAYKAAGPRFQATEKRSVGAVVVGDAKAAQQLVAKVKAGTSISAAAQSLGLEASQIQSATQDDLASQTSDDLAKAAFAAQKGAVIGPVKAALGYYVAKVNDVIQSPATPLAKAKPEIEAELKRQKTQQLLGDAQDKLNDGILDGSNFAELVKDNGLTVQKTQPVLPDGTNPESPDQKADPQLSEVVQAGFSAQENDSPQIVPVGKDGAFALVTLDHVVDKQVKPLDQIKDIVTRNFMIHRAKEKARKAAADAVAAIKKGGSVASAIQKSGLRAPPPQNIDMARADIARQKARIPPPVAMLFSMSEGGAKLLEAPDNQGYYVVALNKIDRGDASSDKTTLTQTRGGLGSVIGNELGDEFSKAVRLKVGVKQNPDALAKIRTSLGGQSAPSE